MTDQMPTPKISKAPLGATVCERCRRPATVSIVVQSPLRDESERRDFCSRDHALDHAKGLWGIGFDFPEVVQ